MEASKQALFERSRSDRLVAGVAGGIAERLGVDATIIRLAFVVLSFAGGFGIIAYLLGWLIGAERLAGDEPPPAEKERRSGIRVVISIAMVVAGMLLLLREIGLWLGDALVFSVGLAAFGSAIIWMRDDGGRARFARLASRLTASDALAGRSKGRVAAGAVLVVAGMITFLVANTSLRSLGNVAFAVAVTVAGLGLILGPWIYGLFNQLAAERRERIRSEERAEVAAHLHDSALQTFAMIQRAQSPAEMVTLARVQERELRAWLYGRERNGADTLSRAVDEMAGRVERLHRVAVETVIVGDVSPLDDRSRALVDALGEATMNAAAHSGAGSVSVYVEVAPDSVTAFVRDFGVGFDVGSVPADRRGIEESIVGRMQRNGGTAVVTSELSSGTEVRLVIPR
jgi:phage shock protein PspC (stress-responsive transcriptional regulator)